MRLPRHFLDLLDRIGKPYGDHRMMGRQLRDRAVEMTLAVAQPPAVPIEGCKRD